LQTKPNTLNPKPYGFWFTFLTTIVLMSIVHASWLGLFVLNYHFEKNHKPDMDISDYINVSLTPFVKTNLIRISAFISYPMIVILTLLIIKFKKGITIQNYLAFTNVSRRRLLKWIITIIGLKCIVLLICIYTGDPNISDTILNHLKNVSFIPAFYFSSIILAPICEEILFRGFMYKGLEKTILRGWGTVIFTSIFFALYHVWNFFPPFFAGMFFGFARKKTNSLYVPIGLHMMWNLISLLNVHLHIIGLY